MDKSVVLGYSGGMDSRTAAERLRAEGYRVVALTIDCMGSEELCSTAKQRASEAGLEWMLYDAREEFEAKIIDNFCSSYSRGLTPAPCTRCNPLIKWAILERVADSLSIEHIATGHYFNVEKQGDLHYVSKGIDPVKDQSYYLWGLQQHILQRALTPMGNTLKSDIRNNFSERSESMGICFLEGKHYSDFLQERGVSMPYGNIVDSSGRIVGEHNGIARYTIGQRRGVGIPEGVRVVDINSQENTLIVGRMEELYKSRLYINESNVVNVDRLLSSENVTIKIRGIGRNPELPVKVEKYGDGFAITCQDKAWAPAKGQPLVFYEDRLVLGGGIVVGYD